MNISNIKIKNKTIDEKIKRGKEFYKDKKIYSKIENISEYIENKLQGEDKNKLDELKKLICEICKNETYYAYKIGLIDGIKNKCI